MTDATSPAALVAMLRMAAGVSQRQLATALGVHRLTVQRWEAGLSTPRPLAMRALWALARDPAALAEKAWPAAVPPRCVFCGVAAPAAVPPAVLPAVHWPDWRGVPEGWVRLPGGDYCSTGCLDMGIDRHATANGIIYLDAVLELFGILDPAPRAHW